MDARTERDFLRTLNETVMRNQAALKEKLGAVEEASRADKAKLVELEDQVISSVQHVNLCMGHHHSNEVPQPQGPILESVKWKA